MDNIIKDLLSAYEKKIKEHLDKNITDLKLNLTNYIEIFLQIFKYDLEYNLKDLEYSLKYMLKNELKEHNND